MKRGALLAIVVAAGGGIARADRYEASVHLQPSAGLASVGGIGTVERVAVPSAGLSGRFTYGMRHWLAIESEVGIASLGAARFADVPITINGGASTTADIERTTRTARLTAAATLRLGVAWIPTVTLGFGGQLRLEGDGRVVGSDVVPDGHQGGLGGDVVAFGRLGLDRRMGRRLVIGVSVGASRATDSPAIDTADVSISVARYWYPLW